ncbi:ThiF family adenylyltransferase [Halalkalibacter urbisdiaboli]|uniref:ThiF family adenylyltransferase n=1 Tax=Halalkalibacter urbisdiaboli TaxID=1960589 RepID=UPI001FD9D54C|nr:ThiF family adenylyltransferase [Halalkalibacter urbisdiaboli]
MIVQERLTRNLGIMSEEDMHKLRNAKIAIAGCGCIGGFSAELLTRIGVGELRIADPDSFDESNINRQCAATFKTIGRNKSEALKEHLLAINPELKITTYSEGVHEENVSDFLHQVDYVIDAIDYFAFPYAVLLHREARQRGIHIITAAAIGFGTTVLAFDPKGMALEEYVGMPMGLTIEQMKGIRFPVSGYAEKLPSYISMEQVTRWIQEKTIPTISVGQALGPGVLVSKMILHILDRKVPSFVPESFQLQFED